MRVLIYSTSSLLLLSMLSACSGCDGCSGGQEITPPVVATPTPPPPVEPDPVAEPAEDAEAVKNALLGLNQAPEPAVAEAAPTPVRRRRPVYEPLPEEELGPKKLSEGAFYSALDAWGGVKRCLAKNPTVKKDGSSAISVRFVVKKDGSVADSKIVGKSNEHAEAIAPCVETEARRVRFPDFEEEDSVQKDAKFVF